MSIGGFLQDVKSAIFAWTGSKWQTVRCRDNGEIVVSPGRMRSYFQLFTFSNIAPGGSVTIFDVSHPNGGFVQYLCIAVHGGDAYSTYAANFTINVDAQSTLFQYFDWFWAWARQNLNAGGPRATCMVADLTNWVFRVQIAVDIFFTSSCSFTFKNASSSATTTALYGFVQYTLFSP